MGNWACPDNPTNGKTDMRYVYQASLSLSTSCLMSWNNSQSKDPFEESAESSARKLQDIQTYMDLIKPIEPGLRGANGAVEFKKSVSRCNVNLNSSSDLLIVTFID